MVNRCAPPDYWGDWADDIAEIAGRHIARISTIIEDSVEAKKEFERFLAELQDDLNPSVTESEAVEMLAQHMVTRPVFEALFGGESFVEQNSVSIAMQSIVSRLEDVDLQRESRDLEKFYESVARRAKEVDTAEGRQNLIRQLYEKFFQKAFKKVSERLGLVFTPVEIVDYILRSVDDILKSEFGTEISNEGVHILDPFTGTGTFPARLLELGLIRPEDLERKYKTEIHANEIVPLAYYIAGINIEKAYHNSLSDLGIDKPYTAFDGLCLTDTFHASSEGSKLDELFPLNHIRLQLQGDLDIRVIVGNPPYSRGQRTGDDNAANLKYGELDQRLEETFVIKSTATLKNPLYDSYVRAIRWAMDRVGDKGIVAFVTNAGWLRGNSMDGLRECLQSECAKIYVLDLRGNARLSGGLWRAEGDKIFGGGSRAPIAVTILVKNHRSQNAAGAEIRYHNIGDNLSRDEKLKRVREFESFGGVPWDTIEPNEHFDWLDQRRKEFDDFIPLGAKRGGEDWTIFDNYSLGVGTNRDAWCWNFALSELKSNIEKSFDFFNDELERSQSRQEGLKVSEISDFVVKDRTKISWSRDFFQAIARKEKKIVLSTEFRSGSYRPFMSQHLHFSRQSCNVLSQQPKFFPTAEAENRVICIEGIGTTTPFSTLMTNRIPDLHFLSTTQCFPLYLYEPETELLGGEADCDPLLARRFAISDRAVDEYRNQYGISSIDKEDIFYFVYGLLHSTDYRKNYQSNLNRALARIPVLEDPDNFVDFRVAGEKLGDLHVNYESAEPYAATVAWDDLEGTPPP